MQKSNKYRQLTLEVKTVALKLKDGSISADEAQTILNEILKEFSLHENKEEQLERTQILGMFFPTLNLAI